MITCHSDHVTVFCTHQQMLWGFRDLFERLCYVSLSFEFVYKIIFINTLLRVYIMLHNTQPIQINISNMYLK